MPACRLGVLLPDEPQVIDASARAHRGRIRGKSVAREGDRLQALVAAHELQMVAVVRGCAALVDLEPDAPVGVAPGL
jgi:hypothetical protein